MTTFRSAEGSRGRHEPAHLPVPGRRGWSVVLFDELEPPLVTVVDANRRLLARVPLDDIPTEPEAPMQIEPAHNPDAVAGLVVPLETVGLLFEAAGVEFPGSIEHA